MTLTDIILTMTLGNKFNGIGNDHTASKFKRSTSVFSKDNDLDFIKQREETEIRFVHIDDISRILSSNSHERNYSQVKDLRYFFRNYPFFKKYKEENGEEALDMLYKVMNYDFREKDSTVIEFGEFGDTFFILFKGSASARIPSLLEKIFTFRELLAFVIENKRWIIKNDKLQHMFYVIQDFLPELIKTNYQGEMTMNYALAELILSKEKILPSQAQYPNFDPEFSYLPKYKDNKKNTMVFKFNMMIEVDVYKPGQSFGELALINNSRRSATITALEDSHFATLDKENFNKIMAKIIK